MDKILTEISAGELLDKISILEIKIQIYTHKDKEKFCRKFRKQIRKKKANK